MEQILRMKHWQLFAIIFAIPFFLQMAIILPFYIDFVSNILEQQNDGMIEQQMVDFQQGIFRVVRWALIPSVVTIVGIWAWMWSMGTFLHSKLPSTVRMPLNRFKIALIFYSVYMAVMMFLVYQLFNTMVLNDPSMLVQIPKLVLIIFPFHILSIVCMFYCIYFTAKVLRSVELQQETSDFIIYFLLIWFYPIGIWFIQPKINRLVQASEVA